VYAHHSEFCTEMPSNYDDSVLIDVDSNSDEIAEVDSRKHRGLLLFE